MSNVRVAIAGVGNCASSLIQGIAYYRDADPNDVVPGLMHVVLGGYPVGALAPVAGGDVAAAKVGRALRAPAPAPRPLLPRRRRGVPGHAGRRGPGAARLAGGRAGRLPARRVRVGAAPLRRGLPRGQGRLRQRHPGLHRLRPRMGEALRGGRRAHRRGRHQEQGRIHHRAPCPDPAVRGPRARARPHVPAERRRKHGLPQHARAGPTRVEEDLQDPGRDQPDRAHPPPGRRHPHRAVRPRAVAARPEVGLHPNGGPELR